MNKEILTMKTSDFTDECSRIPEPMCTYTIIPETMASVLEIIKIMSVKQSASFYGFSLSPSDTDAKLTFRSDSFDLFSLKDYLEIITGIAVTPIDEHFIIELRIDSLYEALK